MSGFLEELLGEKLVTGSGEEVDVHSLGARGISLLGLYFGCSLSAPCAQLSASLAAFYSRLRGDTAAGPGAGAGPGPGAGAAAEPDPRRRLEIVFVSSDQDQRQWQDFVRDMPWLALPYKEKHRKPSFSEKLTLLTQADVVGEILGSRRNITCKLKLWNKYRISNIPSLIFLDATTGKVVCRNGLLVIRDDPEGLEFPWGPKPFREVIAGPLLRNNGQSLDSSSLEGSHVGVYFSAHWCPPCRSLTRVLVESYRKIKEAGQKFEIVFVSADRSEESFKQYFSEMPWLAVPYTDEARRSRLNRLYGIQDSEDDGESEAAKQLIQPIAEKIIAKYKAKEEEAPLLFFVAGEDDMTDSLRDYTNLPEAAPLLTILDMSARAKYVMDVEEITPAIVEAFVNDFLAEKLKPEPI
ncbi:nucleoredoxin isoform X3 [Heterocephalus glaber]|uniref:Nucleoredoxin n=2 Tax=Euarchontoglires TaxID=314146 RepID=A0AAX6RBR6_HETGA|nr:nucleoredoxin isoform X3 [Heterocephalus glaber]